MRAISGACSKVQRMSMARISGPMSENPDIEVFERDIHWVRMAETQLLFMHGNEVLRADPPLSDKGAIFSSCAPMVDLALEEGLKYQIAPASTLTLRVETSVFEIPCLRSEHGFSPCPEDWIFRDDQAIARWVRSQTMDERLAAASGLSLAEKKLLGGPYRLWASDETLKTNAIIQSLKSIFSVDNFYNINGTLELSRTSLNKPSRIPHLRRTL